MSPTNRKLNRYNYGRLAAYATVAGAALAAPANPTAEASIVYSGPLNINIPSTSSGIYLNVVTGVFSSNPALAPGWDINPWNGSSLNFFTPNPTPGGGEMVGSGTTYYNLGPFVFDVVVGPNSSFANAGGTTVNPGTPLFFNSSDNVMGFRFINEAAGNQIQYGWVRISLSGTAASQPRFIVDYAYENTGAPIPEPSAMALLGVMAAGALSVRVWRKRRAA